MKRRKSSNPDTITEYTGNEITIHFDGSCNPNPYGMGSYGFKIHSMTDDGISDHACIGSGHDMTNNVAEWCGLRASLYRLYNMLDRGEIEGDKILIFDDSQLVIRQLTGRWKVKAQHLSIYRNDCVKVLLDIGLPWEALWIPRRENKEADALAEEAIQEHNRSHSAFAII